METGRALTRGLIVGALTCALATAAHSAHGATPALSTVLPGLVLGFLMAMPFCLGRPSPARAIVAVTVGQLALHAWFAWASVPVTAATASVRAGHNHWVTDSGIVTSGSALDLLPSPAMAAAHIAAAVICALALAHCDTIIGFVSRVVRGLLLVPQVVAVPHLQRAVHVELHPATMQTTGITRQPCVRRGPPAPSCA